MIEGLHFVPIKEDRKTDNEEIAIANAPWFPKCLRDFEEMDSKCLMFGEELHHDHPGANDAVYRRRRLEIANIARSYRQGQKIPEVEYTQSEIDTWRTVYLEIRALHQKYAYGKYNFYLSQLEEFCDMSPDRIPQLQKISEFLYSKTQWSLKPVSGLLTSRDFLAGLAFRIFHSTQYVRHPKIPSFTPEPDVIHDVIGHIPMLLDPDFADFSQQIGLISLGASDEHIVKIANCYWYTVEFGLCKENGEIKAYGAGLLSSYSELLHSLSENVTRLPFDPFVASITEHSIVDYNYTYFISDSFENSKRKLLEYSKTLKRPFATIYDRKKKNISIKIQLD